MCEIKMVRETIVGDSINKERGQSTCEIKTERKATHIRNQTSVK